MKSLAIASSLALVLVGSAHAADLTLDPIGTRALKTGYMPVRIALSQTKPARVTKEPAYDSAPKYGTIRLGNGPKSEIAIALDEPSDEGAKIYIDANGDGDLTNDGDGKWISKRLEGRKMYGVHPVAVRASWGDSTMEYGSAPYGLSFYRFVGADFLLMYREATRTGTVTAGDKTYKANLIENDGDAVYNKKMDSEGKPIGKASNPIWLQLTTEGGKTVQVDARAPFLLDGKTYEAEFPRMAPELISVRRRRPRTLPRCARPRRASRFLRQGRSRRTSPVTPSTENPSSSPISREKLSLWTSGRPGVARAW